MVQSGAPGPARFINPDGSMNVLRIGLVERRYSDLHHYLLRSSWKRLFFLVVLVYVGTNTLFAFLYWLDGGVDNATSFGAHFFFSVHTMMTIGYGTMAPKSLFSNILVTSQALFGLLYAAMTTGLFFSKFSLPTARVMFSKVAVVGPRDGVPCLSFRMANERNNQVVEASLHVVLARNETTREGDSMRRFYTLELQRTRSAMFALSWTAIHSIDERSVLFGQTNESLVAARSEVIVSLVGIDETSSQTIHARHAYAPHEIVWGARFRDILEVDDRGRRVVDYRRFHDVELL